MTDKPEEGMSALTKIVVESLIKGQQLDEIAEENNIPLVDAVRVWKDYVQNQTRMSFEETWVLHLLRLDKLLTRAQRVLEVSEDFENIESVLKILDRLEALHALNTVRKTQADEAMIALSEQQGALLASIMQMFASGMVQQVTQIVEEQRTIKGIKGQLESLTGEIVDEQINLAFTSLEAGNNAE